MSIQSLNNKKIALLGFGLDNQALLKLLAQTQTTTEVTICDTADKKSLRWPKDFTFPKNLVIKFQLKEKFNKNLYKFDILFRSPGWPLTCPGIIEAKEIGQTQISSPLNLFFSLCRSKNIIGVTGTKGKGTTASLIYAILKAANQRVWLGGNIGISPLNFLTKIKPTDYIILELSSFQLEDLNYSPKISVITNLFPEHLAPADPHNPNYHASFKLYWQAKLNIANHRENKYLIANQSLKTKIQTAKLKNKKIYFSAINLKTRLVGSYNLQNIAAAVTVAKILKIKPTVYKKSIANFSNLEHRLQLIKTVKGVRYYDNSFSTTPVSTILDLQSFKEPIVQIAGGADKGADFRPLAKMIKTKVKFLVLLAGRSGNGTKRLAKELKAINFPSPKIKPVTSMEAAVKQAAKISEPGDVVLLSTACASFGLFKNYKERGNLFQEYVKKIS